MWQNNLLKYYLENDLERAVEFGEELIEERGNILQIDQQQDLNFSVATALSLRLYDLSDFDRAVELYFKALDFKELADTQDPTQIQ